MTKIAPETGPLPTVTVHAPGIEQVARRAARGPASLPHPTPRLLRIGAAALLAARVILGAGPAAAQSDPEARAAAEVLFREGAAAFKDGDYTTACPKLEGAVAITAGEALGGALLLAQCYEKQGRTASAWGAYTEVAGKARLAGQTRRAEEAERGAAALLPKLHYLALAVPREITALADARVLKQGKPVRRELWTARIPVDPGALSFEVSAPGKRAATKTVEIPASAGETKVSFDPLEDEAKAPAVPPPGPSAAQVPSPTVTAPAPDTSPPGMSGARIAGLAVGAAGVAAMLAGTGIGAAAKGAYDDAVGDADNCGPRAGGGVECADLSKVNSARSLGDAGTVVFFAGVGAAAGGVLLFLLAPAAAAKGPSGAAALVPRVHVGPGGAALTWIGAF